LSSISKKHQVDRKNLRKWFEQRPNLEELAKSNEISIKKIRRIRSSGVKTPYAAIDHALHKWVTEQNEKGLIVKDKYLKVKAKKIADELGYSDFKGSDGYIYNFKQRKNLVSRAHTTNQNTAGGC
jgi:phage anti-repressor protein